MAATRLLVALAMASGAFAQEMFCWMQAPVDATTGGPAARVQIPCPAGINVSISNPWATMQNCLFPIAVNWYGVGTQFCACLSLRFVDVRKF